MGTAAVPAHHLPGKISATSGARFTNPWSAWEERSLWDAWKWQRQRKQLGVNLDGWLEGKPQPTAADFAAAFPLSPVNYAALAQPPADAIQAVWVGHATVLVQMAGLTFITDPVLSDRCSPVQWAGPKRVVPAALQADDPRLPHLDFVLLSHNHFDHLDSGSVDKLNKRFGEKLTWYVPLGLKAWFARQGMQGDNVVELDWWQEVVHKDTKVRIACVPAMHWSARGIMDRRNTLWGGYVVQATVQQGLQAGPQQQGLQQQQQQQQQQQPKQSFYFAGDTGYCEVFKQIGERYGPIDLAAIPIGAYEPRWFMQPQHVNPEEGLQIHRDVRARRSLSIHCCTFALTDEALDEPPRRLVEALASSGADTDEFVTLQHGEMLVVRDGTTLNTPKTLGCNNRTAATAAAAGAAATATVTQKAVPTKP